MEVKLKKKRRCCAYKGCIGQPADSSYDLSFFHFPIKDEQRYAPVVVFVAVVVAFL